MNFRLHSRELGCSLRLGGLTLLPLHDKRKLGNKYLREKGGK